MDLIDECALLGASLLSAQKFEFALYGIISHLSHLPESQKEKRFRNMTPEQFLRGDTDKLKVTLGQLEAAFGNRLLLSTAELTRFVQDRNLIAHNYWRLTKASIRGSKTLANPEAFLRDFLERCDHWAAIARGLLYVLMEAAAKKEQRLYELNFNEQKKNDIRAYHAHVDQRLDPHATKQVPE